MSKFCPFCGEELMDEAKFCKNCGKDVSAYSNTGNNQEVTQGYGLPEVEKSHTLAVVLGVICAFLIPLFGLIFGIYLVTRNDSTKAKKYGTVVIAISLIVWFLSFMTLFMY